MLRSLHLERVGCFPNIDIDLQVVNILVGPGGAGKTYIIDALRWLFLGRVRGVTDERGTFKESFGYRGTTDFLVRADLTGKDGQPITFSRIQEGPSLSNQRVELEVNGVLQQGTREQLEAELYALTTGKAGWTITLDAEGFGNMSSTDQSKVLALIMGGQVTPEELRAKVADALGAVESKLTGGELASALRVFDLEPKPYEWDTAKRHFEEKRRGVRKTIAMVEERLKAGVGEPDPKRLAELRIRRVAVEGEKNAIIREPTPTEDELYVSEKALADAPNSTAADLAKLEAELTAAYAVVQDIEKKPVADPTTEIAGLQESIKATKTSDKPCPYCGHVMDATTLASLKSLLAEKQKQAEAFAAWDGKLTQAQIAGDIALENRDKAIAQAKAYRELATKHKTLMDKAEACKLRRPLADIMSELDGFVAEIAKLDEAERRSDENAKDRAQIEAQQSEEKALDALVKVYAPDGVRQELTAKRDEFLEAVHNNVRYFFQNPNVQIWLDSGKMSLTGAEEDSRSICRFSESERARLGFSIQLAVGAIDGIWLAVSDHFSEVSPNDQNQILTGLGELFDDPENNGTAILCFQIPRPETAATWSKPESDRARNVRFDNDKVQVFAITENHEIQAVERIP